MLAEHRAAGLPAAMGQHKPAPNPATAGNEPIFALVAAGGGAMAAGGGEILAAGGWVMLMFWLRSKRGEPPGLGSSGRRLRI
jgi:hypothetical protein